MGKRKARPPRRGKRQARLDGGPGYDRCYGGAGVDDFDPSCEVQVQ